MVHVFQEQKKERLKSPRQPGECDEPDELDEREEPERFPVPDGDSYWDVFIPDDDEIDPLPDPDDFWIEPEDPQ